MPNALQKEAGIWVAIAGAAVLVFWFWRKQMAALLAPVQEVATDAIEPVTDWFYDANEPATINLPDYLTAEDKQAINDALASYHAGMISHDAYFQKAKQIADNRRIINAGGLGL